MHDIEDEQWIIWNSALGIRDFVTIGRIDTDESVAWLEAPYDMVGPFSLDELTANGLIGFAQCVVMSKQRWQDDREELRKISMEKRRQAQQEMFDKLERNNRHKINAMQSAQREYRMLLELPEGETLEISQIKTAYRRAAKKAHPDAGGSQEMFIRIKEACDALLELV
ncbi:MAG: DnaJ domain-containing protein [Sulfuricurvum sp.]|uniref:DnaJ domain-containing protein n=1 Tax=Sulfuricurvum sp. TaxID=2025608 RepID=UPI002615523B|nr:DnaJ domain-containing protein [Sulfuricurvum sp.]MDD2951085.1 DnaJ domain-containing protein [Sulfuricurvum sp.]MDD5118673.1 DnaJ domain-containing protein [Sulfuricurvum sp.]